MTLEEANELARIHGSNKDNILVASDGSIIATDSFQDFSTQLKNLEGSKTEYFIIKGEKPFPEEVKTTNKK